MNIRHAQKGGFVLLPDPFATFAFRVSKIQITNFCNKKVDFSTENDLCQLCAARAKVVAKFVRPAQKILSTKSWPPEGPCGTCQK